MAVSKWTDREKVKAELAHCSQGSHVSIVLFFIFALLGIISDAANIVLGLGAVSWFLLAIGAIVAGIFFRIGWAVAWYLTTNK